MTLNWPQSYPGVHWYDQQEDQAVLDVLHPKAPFRYYGMSQPKYVEAFEETAKKLYGVRYALAINSGTGALITAMNALGIGPGCEVIVPTFMWVATIGAVVHANAIPVLCEVDESFNLDPKDLKRKITPRTRLIIAVHMTGAPCDMKAIMAIANRRGIPVLEDCAQCNGGAYKGKMIGSFGRISIFSLQINKNCTAGEGGLLVTNDQDLYYRLNAAHDVGVPWVDGGTRPDLGYVTWGNGRRMSELIGAVGSVQLQKLPKIVKHMRASKQRIKAKLKGIAGLSFRKIHDQKGDTGCFLTLILKNARTAAAVIDRLRAFGLPACRMAEYGMHVYYHIPQLVHKTPLSPAGNPWKLPQNAKSVYSYAKGACPKSDALFERSILISIPSCLTRAQENAATKAIKAAMAEQG
ncbi:MAG: DegT/DnrJ/EryC1/StrS family aminotransferase [Phycisphaeraceae bacterium]|nr:DegT/DnrJ/EryC1/StrS family aminotransferase [Phycisphaeraceae bacterium]